MHEVLEELGLDAVNSGVWAGGWIQTPGGRDLESVSPADGQVLAMVRTAGKEDYEAVVSSSRAAFKRWRRWPAPRRGQVVRELGEVLRGIKKPLGALISLEMGKIRAEGEGEVQEAIDIADFAVGLSRQLYGKSMHSERPDHRLYEQWQPLGPVGVISAFNFPVAVWAWNAMVAAVAGDSVIWKPSSKVPLSAIAVQRALAPVLQKHDIPGLLNLLVGRSGDVGESLVADRRIPLISATGSTPMGRHVGEQVAARLGRSLLELGGNNAIIATAAADEDLLTQAVLFGAVGTAGQRCTSTRRLILHQDIYDSVTERLAAAYEQVRVGHPLKETTLMGPLIDKPAVATMQAALETAWEQGAQILNGGDALTSEGFPGGCYVTPAILAAPAELRILLEETFAPILYVQRYKELDEAIALKNSVDQGLSSSIFTTDMREAEAFLASTGSDCGIANVNVGTSGAEIGGAFGGEKDTGGGREAGSDSWKAYMRRQTCTLNWSSQLPLAQGIVFR